ncbi:hypothetical protein AB0I91_13735 [Actinosynnema sp. NPDC049800]
MSGEETQAKGADGARRAKLFLESTTRATVPWVNPDPIAIPKLTFEWADGGTYSFDLGGTLLGGELQGLEFFAESKAYTNANDQGTHYRKFLAQCYRALQLRPERCDKFFWITWSPFLVNSWSELRTPEFVQDSVMLHRSRVFSTASESEARQALSDQDCKAVAERLGFLFLSDALEELTLTKEHLGVIRKYDTMKEDR